MAVKARKRSRAAARAAGSRFVRQCTDWLQEHGFPFAEKAPLWGAKDKGDIVHVRTEDGQHIVVEAKDCARISLATWAKEAEEERVNDSALAGVVLHKRHGVAEPSQQWVTMTLADFAAIVKGTRA